jgi:hypothetical protein
MRKFPDDVPVTSRGFSLFTLPDAGISYWSFDPAIPQLTLAHTTSHKAPAHSQDLHLAFTAWHNASSQPLQVLAWTQRFWSPGLPKDFPDDDTPIVFEFRCGPQSVQLETIVPLDSGANVCFADVTSGEDSTTKLLHGGLLYLYEPAAGNMPAIPNTAAWSTLTAGCDTTVHFDHTEPNHTHSIVSPRVRTLSLCVLAAQFLGACKSLPELGARTPVFQNIKHIFLPAKAVRRTKSGSFGPHSKTLIAFGAAEKVSGLFHLLVFSMQLPCKDKHPRVSVVAAKAFGTKQGFAEPDGTLSPEKADTMFDVALKKCGVQHGIELAWHDCENECRNDEVRVRKMYELGAPGLKEIKCPGLGIVLEGWNGRAPEPERHLSEQVGARTRRMLEGRFLRRAVDEEIARREAAELAESV